MLGPVILDIAGLHLTPEDRHILQHPQVGGVLFFARNFENATQLQGLVADIRAIRPDLLLCVDQEGGRVQRFQAPLTRLPPIGLLGRYYQKDPEAACVLATESGWLMAHEIRSLGVDLSFAPVIDLDRSNNPIIGDRAFASDPLTVTTLAAAYIDGMHRADMRATLKHFPGHGGVAGDSHLLLPEDPRPESQWQEDMEPFVRLMAQGADAVMLAHIVFPSVDTLPVGFSKIWIQSWLRERLGFQGIIFSDDLSMEGAVVMGDYVQRAQAALAAGCDYILVCNNRPAALQVLTAIEGYQPPRVLWKGMSTSPAWNQVEKAATYLHAKKRIEKLKELIQ